MTTKTMGRDEAVAFDANFLRSVANLCRAAYDLCQPKPQRTPEDVREHHGELCLSELASIADEIERRLAAPSGEAVAFANGRLEGLAIAVSECDRLTTALDYAGKEYRRPASAEQCANALRSIYAKFYRELHPNPQKLNELSGNSEQLPQCRCSDGPYHYPDCPHRDPEWVDPFAALGAAMSGRALAQQPAAGVGEEIMVNTPYDVFTLPLQPSGLSSGPRFVVHVPGPQQPAAVDGMVMVQASDLKTLAEFADRGMRGNQAKLAALRAKAILAAQRQEPTT